MSDTQNNREKIRLSYVERDLYEKIQALAKQQQPTVTMPAFVTYLLKLGIKEYENKNQTLPV